MSAPAGQPARSLGLARNTLYNLLGQGSPFLAAVVAIPVLVKALGTDRYGVLTLSWVVIGYFSLFDLGLGRALTQLVAEALGDDRTSRAPALAWTGLALTGGLGVVGTVAALLVTPWLVHSLLKIPPALQPETMHAFFLLAAAIPVIVVSAGLVGILTAFHRFGLLNAIRAPAGMFVLVAPLAVLPFSHSLVPIMSVLVAGRLVTCIVYLWACRPHLPPIGTMRAVPLSATRPLFRFGLWMTVTNVVSPILVSLDRPLIAATVSVAAVAWYATPYEMITKLLIVPTAMLAVLFPAFAATHREQPERLRWLFGRGTAYVVLLLFPVALLVVAFAREGLQLWLGPEFAAHGAPVLRWLAAGVFINAVALVFFNLVQGVGRPDLSARLHLAELPLYVAGLWLAVHNFGIVGAAAAWAGRVTLDAALLLWLSSRFLAERAVLVRRIAGGLVVALAALALPALVAPLLPRTLLVLALLGVYAWVAWTVVLEPAERERLRAFVPGPLRA